MSVKKELHFDNITVPLFVTFNDPDEALQKISQNHVILEIKKIYGYSDISDDNWTEYYDALFELLDLEECPIWYTEENTDFRMLRNFFDIFENESKNNEIEVRVTENKHSISWIRANTFAKYMGFVTDRKTTQLNGYYDYRVAQHTSNYHEWTSSSKNGWENVGKDGGTYGRVRR